MEFLIPSFFAGVLTILAPCVLSLLPVILGGSMGQKSKFRPLIISLSLGGSVIIFTLLLKASASLIDIPQAFWRYLSGTLITAFALTMIFPDQWNKLSFKLKLYKSEGLLAVNSKREGHGGALMLGASLGPVFTTCSPTYTLILAIVLPQNFTLGVINLLSYTLGLVLILTLIGYGGQKITSLFKPLSNPRGLFKKILGIILLLTGLLIFTGLDKKIEEKVLESGYLGPIKIEQNLIKESKKQDEQDSETPSSIQKKFKNFSTDLSKRGVEFDQILPGGPGKDGIPALDNPAFIKVSESSLGDDDMGIFLEINGEEKFYPFSILVWHEVVNDQVGGKPLAITFCPLCGSSIVFNRKLNDQILDFSVSGFLYQSNLLMYDRQTESFWSQSKGEALLGSLNGSKLTREEMQRIPFGELKEKHPNAKVLSRETGYNRDYTANPYGNYAETESLYFPVSIEDNRFFAKEIMLVVPLEDVWVAFPWQELKNTKEAKVNVKGHNLQLAVDGSEIKIDYRGESLASYYEMWFSFATHHQQDSIIWTP